MKYHFNFFMIFLLSIGMCSTANAQTIPGFIDLKGVITDENNRPVPASVIVKGTGVGAAANAEGVFELKQVERNATLVITAVGFISREIVVKGRNNLGTIVLTAAISTTEEVLVRASTGYESLKPNEINGSVSIVDNKTLNLQTGSNILKRLDATVSGLLFNTGKTNDNPQNKTGISIRGLGTINGPLDPLIVLDGFIYEGNIDNINPNDVEDITVLKDAAAASIWGARAGNGVIVITTKKGRLQQKMQVSASSGFIVTERPDLSSIPQMSVADFIEVEELLFRRGYFNSRINFTPYLALTPAVNIFLQRRLGRISAADSALQIDALKNTDARSQYERLIYSSGILQQHSVSMRGGGQNNAYSFSAGYDNNSGQLQETYKKLNLRLLNTYQLRPRIRLNIESYYTNSNARSGQRPYGTTRAAGRAFSYHSLINADGSPAGIDLAYNTAMTDTLLNGRLLDQRFYLLEDYKHNRSSNSLQELNANAGINVQLRSFLNMDIKYQYQLQHTITEKLADIESYEARELINSFTQVIPTTGALKYIVPMGGIRTLSNARVGSQTFRVQLNLNKQLGEHRLKAIGGTELREQKSSGDSYTTYGYNANPLTTAVVDNTGVYTDPISGASQSVSGSPRVAKTVQRFTALYLNGSWLWKEKYCLSASARRDGSNIFGANSNDRWKPLWSVGGSWNISKESFFKASAVNDLRIKLSYGHSGNVDLSRTAVPIASLIGPDIYTNLPFSNIRQINNPSLRWEKVKQLNAGIEFTVFSNRISGSLDWYSKQGTDLYGPVEWDYTGFGSSSVVVQNIADTKGRGIDLVINTKNSLGNIKWSSGFLLGYNKTITKKYYGPQANGLHTLLGGGSKITPVVGRDVYGIMAYKWGGLDSLGNPQGYLDGKLSKDYYAISQEAAAGTNLQYFGSGTPRVFAALQNTVTYKNFSLTVSITAKLGYYFIKPALMYSSVIAGGAGTNDYARRWKKRGDELITDVPAFYYPNNLERDYFYSNSSVQVQKGDHLRLQYVNLTYTPHINNKKLFKDFQVYANAANLGILWRANSQQLDPDYPRGMAPTRAWSLGVRVNF